MSGPGTAGAEAEWRTWRAGRHGRRQRSGGAVGCTEGIVGVALQAQRFCTQLIDYTNFQIPNADVSTSTTSFGKQLCIANTTANNTMLYYVR